MTIVLKGNDRWKCADGTDFSKVQFKDEYDVFYEAPESASNSKGSTDGLIPFNITLSSIC